MQMQNIKHGYKSLRRKLKGRMSKQNLKRRGLGETYNKGKIGKCKNKNSI